MGCREIDLLTPDPASQRHSVELMEVRAHQSVLNAVISLPRTLYPTNTELDGHIVDKTVCVPRKLGVFLICTSNFFALGRSKNAFPCAMTSSINASLIPVFLIYRNPTSRRALRKDSRKIGLVVVSRASERSRMGMESKDMVML